MLKEEYETRFTRGILMKTTKETLKETTIDNPTEKKQTAKRVKLSESSLICKVPGVLGEIRLFKMAGSENWMNLQVTAIDDESFHMFTAAKDLVFKDDDLKPDEEGKIILNIEPLNLKFFYPSLDLPIDVEIPGDVLEERKEKRRRIALAKNAICIIPYQNDSMYFYLEGDKLRILYGEKEVTANKIEIIYGKKAVDIEGLELGHPYIELPVNVAEAFEKVLLEKKLKSLALVPAGKSLLNGYEYHSLNMDLPANRWEKVKGNFEYFGEEGDMKGWLTCVPGHVAEILNIPIEYN